MSAAVTDFAEPGAASSSDVPSDSRTDLERYLHAVIERVPGLRAVFVCDRDGVVLLKSTAASDNVSDDDEATLAAAFAISADQVAKVHLGRVRTMAAFFGKQIIVHINVLPLVVAMVAEPDANVGVLMALEQDFVKALAALRTSVEQLDKI